MSYIPSRPPVGRIVELDAERDAISAAYCDATLTAYRDDPSEHEEAEQKVIADTEAAYDKAIRRAELRRQSTFFGGIGPHFLVTVAVVRALRRDLRRLRLTLRARKLKRNFGTNAPIRWVYEWEDLPPGAKRIRTGPTGATGVESDSRFRYVGVLEHTGPWSRFFKQKDGTR